MGIAAFYTVDPLTGRVALIEVVDSPLHGRYLRTVADGVETNNLC